MTNNNWISVKDKPYESPSAVFEEVKAPEYCIGDIVYCVLDLDDCLDVFEFAIMEVGVSHIWISHSCDEDPDSWCCLPTSDVGKEFFKKESDAEEWIKKERSKNEAVH